MLTTKFTWLFTWIRFVTRSAFQSDFVNEIITTSFQIYQGTSLGQERTLKNILQLFKYLLSPLFCPPLLFISLGSPGA